MEKQKNLDKRPDILDPSAMEDLLKKTRMVSRVFQNRKEMGSPDYQKVAKLLSELSTAIASKSS